MLRYLLVLLLSQAVLGSIPSKYLRDDLTDIEDEILEGLDDYDEEVEREKQEIVDERVRKVSISSVISSVSFNFDYSSRFTIK